MFSTIVTNCFTHYLFISGYSAFNNKNDKCAQVQGKPFSLEKKINKDN